jgi:hypothetical protein
MKKNRPKPLAQGCQMVYFQTKNPKLGKCSRALQLKMMVKCMANLPILRPIGIYYAHWVHFVVIWDRRNVFLIPQKNLAKKIAVFDSHKR